MTVCGPDRSCCEPLGDAQLGLWTPKAVKEGLNARQIDDNVVFNMAATRPDLLTGGPRRPNSLPRTVRSRSTSTAQGSASSTSPPPPTSHPRPQLPPPHGNHLPRRPASPLEGPADARAGLGVAPDRCARACSPRRCSGREEDRGRSRLQRAHLRLAATAQLRWCFEVVLSCAVAEVDHSGMPEPVLVVRFLAVGTLASSAPATLPTTASPPGRLRPAPTRHTGPLHPAPRP